MDSIHPPVKPKLSDPAIPLDTGEMAYVVLESLADSVYVLDRHWRMMFVNQAFVRHMGIAKADLLGRSLWDTLPAAQHPFLRPIYSRVMETGVAEALVQQSVIHPGITVDIRIFPVFDGIAIVFRDITRRMTAERALATSEAHLRLALEGAAMGDWAWNAETDEMSLSDQARRLYGLEPDARDMSREELRRARIHPDDVAIVRDAADQAQSSQLPYDVEYRVLRGEEWCWMRVMGKPDVRDEQIVGMHGLVQDIDDRKRANDRLQAEIVEREKAQQRQQLLIHELNHRVKNILAMVQAIAAQTLSTAATPEAARASLESRLIALAQAHDVLTRESWDGAELMDIITGAVAPHERQIRGRFHINGPHVRLAPKTAVSMAMAVHELATNAVKYGALANDGGWVEIGWTVQPVAAGIDLRLSWVERGGPPVTPPERRGFGTRLIARSLGSENGVAELTYPPEGARCEITVVLPVV
jgi:PAS domain S-box-containing protein